MISHNYETQNVYGTKITKIPGKKFEGVAGSFCKDDEGVYRECVAQCV